MEQFQALVKENAELGQFMEFYRAACARSLRAEARSNQYDKRAEYVSERLVCDMRLKHLLKHAGLKEYDARVIVSCATVDCRSKQTKSAQR
ncbi:MAG: hypothetical protein ACOYNL_02005 [Rickettsiales bacterium]